MKLPHDPAIPFLDIYPKEMKSISQRDICTLMYIAALLTKAKILEECKCPSIDGWIKKIRCVYVSLCVRVCTEILFNHKKKGNPTICDNVDEHGGHYAK